MPLRKPVRVLWAPNPGPQTAFLVSQAREVLYGGAAGGGKTDALSMLPLYRCHNPKHRSIIFRRTRPQLQEVIDRQQQLYPLIDPGCKWQEDKSRWVWSSGAITQMGYMEHEQDRFKFKTFEYDLIAFDELTSFTEKMYLFMFSRNRTKDASMPARMCGGTNPGDVGHQWVFDRFIANREPFHIYEREVFLDDELGKRTVTTTQQFIPAKLVDNPMMADRNSYIVGLKEMGEDGEAYLAGDWRAFSGQMFRKPLVIGPELPWTEGSMIVRCIDYGWADPLCIMWLRAHRNGVIEILHELYQPQLTVDSIATLVKSVELELRIRPTLSVSGHDMHNTQGSSAQSIASMLTARGVWSEKANNDRVAGWARVQQLLQAERLYARFGRAPNLVRTLPNLVRDPNKPDDVKDKQEDHAAECLRYGVMAIHDAIAVQPVAQPAVTEHDPVFKRIMSGLQKNSQMVIFPGLEG